MELDDATLKSLEHLTEMAVNYGLDVLGAVAILVIGWLFAGWLYRRLLSVLKRTEVDATLRPVIATVARYAVLVFVVIAVLAQFGVQTTSIIAALGAAGLAIGLALQGTLQNIAAGFMLLFLRPFRVGDYIDAEGQAGTVDEIGLFVTQLTTFDGLYVSVPNSKIWGSAIINYSRLPTRRLDVVIGISYDDDVDQAQSVLLDLLKNEPRVLDDPPAQVLVKALADSSVNLNLRCWCDRDDYWDLLFFLNQQGKRTVEAAGMSIPFPQRDVHIVQENGEAAGAATSAQD